MIPGVRLFVIIILALTTSTVVVPLLSRENRTAQNTITQGEILRSDTGQTTDQPLTLAGLGYHVNLQPDTIKMFGVVLVLVVIVVGLKFMSAGGAHH